MLNRPRIGLWFLVCLSALLAGSVSESDASQPVISLGGDQGDVVPSELVQPVPIYAVIEAGQAPKIDGKLDDAVWQKAQPLGRMYLDNGEGVMRLETFSRLVRHGEYLYLAMDCRHPEIDSFTITPGKRDKVDWGGETVEFFVDTGQGDLKYA